MIIFAFKKAELKEKTQDANFSLPIKNPNPLLKNGFRISIWIPKLGGFRIRIANPTFSSFKTKNHPLLQCVDYNCNIDEYAYSVLC